MWMNGYQCLTCGETYPVDFSGYTCAACGGNLEITYDYRAIGDLWQPGAPSPSPRTDLFRYAPFLPITSIDSAPPLPIGPTPLIHVKRLGDTIGCPHLYAKDDGQLPSNSFKDRASAVAIARAIETNADVVAGASTGNAGSSMACMAAAVGLPCVIFVPEAAPPAKMAQLLIYGAQVLAVRGSYDDAFDLCMNVCEERNWFNRNTGYNPFTREGKKTVSFEICEQFDWNPPDHILVATGDGNIISGVWKGIRDLHAAGWINRLPRVHCAQAAGSAAITRTVHALRKDQTIPTDHDWRGVQINPVQANTLADSISVDAPRDGLAAVRAVIESGGEAVAVSDNEILHAMVELARTSGLFVEPSAAATWAALKVLVQEERIDPESRIVLLLTGNGLKDIGNARKAVGNPIPIDPTPEAALAALSQ